MCGAAHPSDAEILCTVPGNATDHAMHVGRHPQRRSEGPVTWPNDEFVEPIGNPRRWIEERSDEERARNLAERTAGARREIDEDVAPVGASHPENAKAAARRVLPRTGTKRRQAYDLIRDTGGRTGEEVGLHFGWPHQSYSPIISTLEADGWITPSGEFRTTESGNRARVMVVVDG